MPGALPTLNLVAVSLPPSAVAVITPERSPRPTSAPAIAQSHLAEAVPAKPDAKEAIAVSKAEKEAVRAETKREEIPPERAKAEPADASKVWQSGLSLEEAGARLEPQLKTSPSSSSGHLPFLCDEKGDSSPRQWMGGRYGDVGPREFAALPLRIQREGCPREGRVVLPLVVPA